jgi:hypothetical protein
MPVSTIFQLYHGGKNLHIKTNIVKKQKYLSNVNLTKLPTFLGGCNHQSWNYLVNVVLTHLYIYIVLEFP